MATTPSIAPTREFGSPVPTWAQLGGGVFGTAGSSATLADREYVPELIWPRSVQETYPRMGTDSQLDALMRGTILPISRYTWTLDPNGARPELVDAISAEFNLPLAGAEPGPLGRAKRRFSFAKHRDEALDTALRYGHAFYQQVGDVVPLTEDGDGLWHLRKLAPRPPWSILDISIADDGGLVSIRVPANERERDQGRMYADIPVDYLVAYVWSPEPGSWFGRSMFRSCYREWMLKDLELRIDAQNHEKGGGVWYGEAHKDATPTEKAALAELAGQMNSVMRGSIAVPAGDKLHLERPGGSNTAIDSVNRHDEAMARAFLLMLIQLGQTQSGSRAVGDSFNDLFAAAQQSIATWFRDVFNEHVIEDWVDWNYGPAEEYVPRVVFELGQAATTGPLDAAVEQDPALAAVVARVKDELEQPGQLAVRARAVADAVVPGRALRRQPYEHEVRAQTDFAALERIWENEVAQLVAAWQHVKRSQVDDLRGQIERAGADLGRLAAVKATPAGSEIVAPVLTRAAVQAAHEALAEAKRQGIVHAELPSLEKVEKALASRSAAVAELFARSLSEAGGRKAVQLAGGSLSAAEVADETARYLDDLSVSYLADQFGGAVNAAQNAGRLAVMRANGATSLYASELLDTNTCEPCRGVDGREFASFEEASKVYPTGGFAGCLGGPRCRGTIVAVYDEAGGEPVALAAARAPRQLDERAVAALVSAEVEAALARLNDSLAARAVAYEEKARAAQDENRSLIGRAVDEFKSLVGMRERPLEIHVHEGDVEHRVEIPEGAIQTHVAPAQVDVHLPAQPRPRAATARRRDDGSLEVTYDDERRDA